MERKSSRSASVPRLLSRLTTRAWEKDADIEGRRATNSDEAGLKAPYLTYKEVLVHLESLSLVRGSSKPLTWYFPSAFKIWSCCNFVT